MSPTLSSLSHDLAQQPHLQELVSVIDQLRNHATYLYEQKHAPDTTSEASRIDPSILFTRLKALNRTTAQSTKLVKQQTYDARSQIDTNHLALQNLWYKRAHLEREIARCKEYESVYQDVDMPTEEEYVDIEANEPQVSDSADVAMAEDGAEGASATAGSQTPYAELDPHSKMLRRQNRELADREALDKTKKELQAQKQALIKENKVLEDELEKLDAQLEAFVASAKPIQEVFDKH